MTCNLTTAEVPWPCIWRTSVRRTSLLFADYPKI